MPSTRTCLLTVIATIAAVGAAAAPASAIDARFKAEHFFRVSVTGTQTTTWTSQDAFLAGCLEGERGEGAQVVKFRSGTVPMHAYEGVPQPFFFKKGDRGQIELKLSGTVERRAAFSCADPFPPAAQPDDCGTKTFSGVRVMPRYLYGSNRVVLEQPYGDGAPEFDRCPIFGDEWPYLLKEADGRPVGRDLPAARLFGRRKTALTAEATSVRSAGGSKATTTIRWTVTFKRVRTHRLR